jgi:hypothetical protein
MNFEPPMIKNFIFQIIFTFVFVRFFLFAFSCWFGKCSWNVIPVGLKMFFVLIDVEWFGILNQAFIFALILFIFSVFSFAIGYFILKTFLIGTEILKMKGGQNSKCCSSTVMYFVIFLLIVWTLLIGYFYREYRKSFTPKVVDMNSLPEFTREELAQYNGKDEATPLYLGIKGLIFDVSAGRSHYGPNGGLKKKF